MISIAKLIHQKQSSTNALGELGERLAADHLRRRGYRIICSNFRAPIGRNRKGAVIKCEIDIVALEGESLCFVEVKTRSAGGLADPLLSVNRRKQRQVTRAARVFRRTFGLTQMRRRYDVVSIVTRGTRPPKITVYKGHWNEHRHYVA